MGIHLPNGIKGLLVANAIAFVPTLLHPFSQSYYGFFALRPAVVVGHLYVWQVLSYAFLHAGPWHFLFNMLALYFFGRDVEESLGTKRFLILYLGSAVGAGLLSIPFFWHGMVVGASGAILALLYVFARLFPYRQIILFFLLPPVPAMVAVVIYGTISLVLALSSSGGNVAHLTHLAGLLMGILFWRYRDRVDHYLVRREVVHEEKKRQILFDQERKRREYFDRQVDPILEKISKYGIQSLTQEEKAILAQAKKYRKG